MRFEPVANRIGHRSVANRRKLELLNNLCPEGNQSIRLTIEIPGRKVGMDTAAPRGQVRDLLKQDQRCRSRGQQHDIVAVVAADRNVRNL